MADLRAQIHEKSELLKSAMERGIFPSRSVYKIHALRRGIGVHHQSADKKYRQVALSALVRCPCSPLLTPASLGLLALRTSRLHNYSSNPPSFSPPPRNLIEHFFRLRRLRVIIATSTLAQGINMPCRTVVFAGDSAEFNSMTFRQMAGRAGRRGYDKRGDVVFFGMPSSRVLQLVSSSLPRVVPTFPNTTFHMLRLLGQYHKVSRGVGVEGRPRARVWERELKETHLTFLGPPFLVGCAGGGRWCLRAALCCPARGGSRQRRGCGGGGRAAGLVGGRGRGRAAGAGGCQGC